MGVEIISIFMVGFVLGFIVAAYICSPRITFLQIDREAAERRLDAAAKMCDSERKKNG